jgi:hypothetical protein
LGEASGRCKGDDMIKWASVQYLIERSKREQQEEQRYQVWRYVQKLIERLQRWT